MQSRDRQPDDPVLVQTDDLLSNVALGERSAALGLVSNTTQHRHKRKQGVCCRDMIDHAAVPVP